MFCKVPQSSLGILRVPQLPPPLEHPPLKNPTLKTPTNFDGAFFTFIIHPLVFSSVFSASQLTMDLFLLVILYGLYHGKLPLDPTIPENMFGLFPSASKLGQKLSPENMSPEKEWLEVGRCYHFLLSWSCFWGMHSFIFINRELSFRSAHHKVASSHGTLVVYHPLAHF